MKDQKKAGIIISYLNIILNMCINIFFTPFLISSLGQEEYGLYRIVQSLIGQLSIMTFGMSALVTRNIAYYDAKGQQKEKENFLSLALMISVFLSIIVFIAGMFICSNLNLFFKSSFTNKELQTATKLTFLFVINIVVIVINDMFAGFITGHEKFAIANGIRTFKMFLRIITLIVLLKLGFKSIAIVATDLMLSLIMLLFNIIYGMAILKEKIHFYYFDKNIFRTTLFFCSAILLQALINQVNQNMDSVILGVMTNTSTVAIYSIALLIYTTYNSITITVSNVLTPKATRLIANNATSDKLRDFVIVPGRYQFMLAGAIIIGFILFGKDFISIWLTPEYLPAYKISIILMLPMTFSLITSACNAILDAQLRRFARSVILCAMALINVASSVLFIKKFGYIGAAYGTALSVIAGNLIIINIYYTKIVKLNMYEVYSGIFSKILPSILVISIISIPLKYISFYDSLLISFIIKITLFLLIYCTIVYRFGMNISEKNLVKNTYKKLLKKGDKNVQK